MEVRAALLRASATAIANQSLYSRLDAEAGDGDFGAVLARAARKVQTALEGLEDVGDRETLLAAATAIAAVGGTTGPIWGIGLLRAAEAINGGGAAALRAAAEGIAELGGAKRGDRTLLDALLPAVDALESGGDAAAGAREGAERTAQLIARVGRASYVAGQGAGHIDAGAQAIADLIGAVNQEAPPAGSPGGPEHVPSVTASPGHVVADPDRLVDDAVAGLLEAAGGRLRAQLDPRFVARADLPKPGLVALISGGGAGHEPMHTGLIGPGLLAAACPGEVFASPSAAQVQAAIADVDGGAGVLLIVKNYTGDVLNFRLGAALARNAGHQVETVLIADDIAAGERGVAGTIVVEKVCGAAAEAGADLHTVAALGRRVAAGVRSIGVAFSGVTLPSGGAAAIALELGQQEFGIGIHGEAGRERGLQQPADELVARMCDALLAEGPLPSSTVLLYTNGLGGLAGLELSAVHGYAARHLRAAGLQVARSMAGALVTSLGMVGFSLTVASLEEDLIRYWDAPCSSSAWTV